MLHPDGYELKSHQRIRIGKEYLVVGIICGAKATYLRIVDDDMPPFPSSLWPLAMFDVVSPQIPSIWRVAIDHAQAGSSVVIEPEDWLRRGFWVDLDSEPPRGNDARAEYRRDVMQMMVEEKALALVTEARWLSGTR
jgi:hypothetical protein